MISSYTILDPESSATRVRPRTCALAVMIKAPRAGASKTRLVPPLTHEEAAALSVCFLRDTAENIDGACASLHQTTAPQTGEGVEESPRAAGVAVYTPAGAEAAFEGLLPRSFALLAQRGEEFGARLLHAAEDLLRLGYDSLCLIDSDSPTLPQSALASAARALDRPGDRVVLGPADDGGYYLIGLRRPHGRLFEEITWSTEHVLRQTIERGRELNLEVELLPTWYDVDDAATLARLCAEQFGPGGRGAPSDSQFTAGEQEGYEAPHTREFLARLIAREGRARIWPQPGQSGAAGTRAGALS